MKEQELDMDGCSTEIRTFYSLKEIRENVESDVIQYKAILDDYSQWLGSLLRDPESSKNQEWVKKIAELQKVLKTGNKKPNSKKDEKKKETATDWVQFKDVMLSADTMGEAEILFDAVEELKNKIGNLERAKTSITDLEKYGLGKDLLYITYIHDGVPEKIFFKPKTGTEAAEKFAFIADFSMAEQTK
jgi:hypothetical protein